MKLAVALSGGGTKGSYELGVWKALRELNIDYEIVTGTSIGSINGALMAVGDYDRAYELWNTIKMEDMMEDGINLTDTIEGIIDQREAIGPFLKKYVRNRGADISPFTAFIHELIDEDEIRRSGTDFGLVTVQFPSLTPCELTKQDIPRGKMKDYILASSAIFPLFPMHEIDGVMYLDGCYHDNLPICLALRMGAEHVIAVDLHTTPEHMAFAKRAYVTYIKPSRPLGTMMNFDHELLMENARMGYQDTMKAYGIYYGWQFTFDKESTDRFQKEMDRFQHGIAMMDVRILSELPGRRTASRADHNRIHRLLSSVSGVRNMSKCQYFTAAAEVCGNIFGLDAAQVYKMEDFTARLTELAASTRTRCCRAAEGEKTELAGRLAEMKWNKDRPGIAAAIYYAMVEGQLSTKLWMRLMTAFPEELTAAMFLASLQEATI